MARIVAFVLFLVASNLAAAQDLGISNGRILDGTGGSIEQGSIVVRDGRIVSVSAGDPEVQGVLEIDAQGMTVMPGLIDTHCHLLTGSGATNDEELDDWIRDQLPSCAWRQHVAARQLGLQDLERDLTLVLQVIGQVDGGHAALTQFSFDGVAAF